MEPSILRLGPWPHPHTSWSPPSKGTTRLSEGTALFDNRVERGTGANLMANGAVYVQFPLRSGHWLPNSECIVHEWASNLNAHCMVALLMRCGFGGLHRSTVKPAHRTQIT